MPPNRSLQMTTMNKEQGGDGSQVNIIDSKCVCVCVCVYVCVHVCICVCVFLGMFPTPTPMA